MIRNLPILFIADQATGFPAVQATPHSPPASLTSARRGDGPGSGSELGRLKFVACVAGNAVGFAGLIAGCWLGLQVLQAFL